MTITPEDLVRREVHYCVSSLVSTLASGVAAHTFAWQRGNADLFELQNLTEQAFELAAPVDDWEEAAIEAGWSETSDGSDGGQHVFTDKTDGQTWCAHDWQSLCADHDIEPYAREVFEHWIVSDWLADKLEAKGEKVDKDFAGLTVWARTTTGQGIACDWVIEAICAELNQ